jgi:hypothetical protein
MHWPWVWSVGLGAAAVAATASHVRQLRERRHAARPGEELVADAVTAMAGLQHAQERPGMERHRGLVELLAAQQAWAEHTQERVGGAVHALNSGAGKTLVGVDGADDLERAVSAQINTLPDITRIQGVQRTPEFLPKRQRGQPIGPVPTLERGAEIGDLFTALSRTVEKRIRHMQALVSMAMQSGNADAAANRELSEAAAAAAAVSRDSLELARDGRYLTALQALAGADLPIPLDGVPGEATRRELEQHAVRLREIAEDHDVALRAWCADALGRCSAVRQKGVAR